MRIPAPPDPRGVGEPGLRRKAAGLASVLVLIALAVGALFGDRGFLQLLAQQRRVETLAKELEELRHENRSFGADIEALRNDPRAIEKLAREELGLARPGELVFVIREEPPGAKP